MFLKPLLAITLASIILTGPVIAETPAPEGAEAYIISPVDGAEVTSPVTVKFGLKGMGVAPAGTMNEKTGHHHLLIDVDGLPDLNMPIPADANHKHFGGGQTEASIDLTPGKHTLQLLVGDVAHIPHLPPIHSEKITIMVK